jgi:hypothetical protein
MGVKIMINLTDGIMLSSKTIEEIVTSEKLEILPYKDYRVENNYRLPSMMYTLWGYVCTYRAFPCQSIFTNYYLSIHAKVLRNLDQAAIKARMLRSYPSLMREIHFYFLILESNLFNKVIYSAFEDVEHGIDLTISLGQYDFYVSCFLLTKRSQEFRRRKVMYRNTPKVNSIELGLNLDRGKRINGWVFYSEEHLQILLNKIIGYTSKNFGLHPLDLLCS